MTPLIRWILSLALAYVFIIFGADKLMNSANWIGWLPLWMNGLLGIASKTWLMGIGITELLIGIGLVVPKRSISQIAALLGTLHLLSVIIIVASFSTTLWNDQILVRDIGLLAMAIVLIF